MVLKKILLLLAFSFLPSFAFGSFTREVGPIRGNDHAQQVCPVVCANSNGTFDGNWWTSEIGKKSVCSCGTTGFVRETNPIWSNIDAQQVCPKVCAQARGNFDGNWWHTSSDRSACACGSEPYPAPQDDCNRPTICTLNVQPATCTDTITGKTLSGTNSCAATRDLKRDACSSGSTTFSSLTVSCVDDRFEF